MNALGIDKYNGISSLYKAINYKFIQFMTEELDFKKYNIKMHIS